VNDNVTIRHIFWIFNFLEISEE